MTIQEIEAACDRGEELDFRRHAMEGPALTLQQTLYPYGVPTVVRSNSVAVMEMLAEMWQAHEACFAVDPIHIEIQVLEGGSAECPPAPDYRMMLPLLTGVADKDNYMLIDLAANRTYMTVSSEAVKQKKYLQFFFLESTAGIHIGTRYMTPVHGGFVSLEGLGILLCGDSGAGKSTLSYACARAGWTYVTDDCSFLRNDGDRNLITGNCYRVRFRPTAADLFPEVAGVDLTPRAGGKPSIELPTGPMGRIARSQIGEADYVVFLNRHSGGPAELVPYRKGVARQFLRSHLYGMPETLAIQYRAIERLLAVDVLELRYTDLDWAIERLQKLVKEGR